MLGLACRLPPGQSRRLLGLLGTLGVVLFLMVGCETSGERKPSAGIDRSTETGACPKDQRAAASESSGTEAAPTGDCFARNQPQGSEPATLARSTPNSRGPRPKAIPGMDAEAALTILQKPGLECWQPADKEVLYACDGHESPDLLYEASIKGFRADEVSGIEARVFWRGTGHFEQASRPFFGLLGAQLHYRGASGPRAFEFVNHNLRSGATTTIGAAKWTMTTSDDSKQLTVMPAH